ncbi:hypothetical protein [Streptomyces sp. SAJ15]|uniref:hypothetical protein n=1 Tax=Streptomyces sp. SAJ15 TaxID=2011095 RepID=UPI0021B2C552|nr:hypothetical protein [Streptomyces sp. SAJ15]
MTTAPTTTEESTIASVPLSVDCTADSAGGLTFDIADWPAEVTPRDAALLLRRRGSDPADEVRLPLATDGAGRPRAVLPAADELPEGRWDAYLAQGEESPTRLAPGLNDLRALVDRQPAPGTSPLGVRIPYPTKYGNLSVRSWSRAPHAEAGEIVVDQAGMTVRGRLHRVADAAGWLSGALVEARCRDAAALVRTVPVEAGDGPEFRFTLDYAELAAAWEAGEDAWDLWLSPGPDGSGDPVRIARILDDVPDKKEIFTYPTRTLAAPHEAVKAGPYYTADNDLSVRVSAAG